MLGRGVRSIPNRPPTATSVAAAHPHADHGVCTTAAVAATGLGRIAGAFGDVAVTAAVSAVAAGGEVCGGVVGEALALGRGMRSAHVRPPTTTDVTVANPHDVVAAERGSCSADAVHEVRRRPGRGHSAGSARHLPPPFLLIRRCPIAQRTVAPPQPPVHSSGGRPRLDPAWALPIPCVLAPRSVAPGGRAWHSRGSAANAARTNATLQWEELC